MRRRAVAHGCTRWIVPMCFLLVLLVSVGCRKSGVVPNPASTTVDPNVFNVLLAHSQREYVRLDLGELQNVNRVRSFLQLVVVAHYKGIVAAPDSPLIFADPAGWLRKTEKSEEVLREVCRAPTFTFAEDHWTVVFNVIRATGAVDEWKVVARCDPADGTVSVLSVEITNKMPPGTFSWCLVG